VFKGRRWGWVGVASTDSRGQEAAPERLENTSLTKRKRKEREVGEKRHELRAGLGSVHGGESSRGGSIKVGGGKGKAGPPPPRNIDGPIKKKIC